jgi:rhodanese-related sulfurtransferase
LSLKTITPHEVEGLLKTGNTLNIIDVRENDEVSHGMIPGAKHIPLGEVPNRLNELDQSKEYIMVCRSGKRSEKACVILSAKDIKVTNMIGGMLNWEGQTK